MPFCSCFSCSTLQEKDLSGFSRQQKQTNKQTLSQSWNQRNEGASFLIREKAALCECLHLPGRLPITEVHSEFTEAEQVQL